MLGIGLHRSSQLLNNLVIVLLKCIKLNALLKITSALYKKLVITLALVVKSDG